jgi:hypothetical protein
LCVRSGQERFLVVTEREEYEDDVLDK